MGKFFKKAEFAPGIPDKNIISEIPKTDKVLEWNYVLHEHHADRAGKHYDFRLGDPLTNKAHSWVIKEWPKPGEKVLAIQQPTHTVDYMSFSGEIPSGYGKGIVNIADSGKVEIIKSDGNKITFYRYKNNNVEKYSLVKVNDKDWILINNTFTKELNKYYNEAPKFKMKPAKNIKGFEVPKIDGAYSVTILKPEKKPVILSPRVSSKTNLPIDYTPKIPDALNYTVPKELGNTVLRTEVFSVTPEGKELPNRILGGILNSNVYKSREKQKELNAPLQLAVTDVVRYKGKKVENLPIEEKYKIIKELSQKVPFLHNPLELQNKYNFSEGKIVWKNNKPYKVKNEYDYDVYVKDIFPANVKTKKPQAGGFYYSLKPDGPIVGKVGTGFTEEERIDMLNNKDKYINVVAKIKALEQHPSGAYRMPSFINWHLDKGVYNG